MDAGTFARGSSRRSNHSAPTFMHIITFDLNYMRDSTSKYVSSSCRSRSTASSACVYYSCLFISLPIIILDSVRWWMVFNKFYCTRQLNTESTFNSSIPTLSKALSATSTLHLVKAVGRQTFQGSIRYQAANRTRNGSTKAIRFK